MNKTQILIAALAITACKPAPPPAPPPSPPSDVEARRLRDHIVEKQRPIYVERDGDALIWSDRAFIERAASFAPVIRELIESKTAHDAGTLTEGAMKKLLDEFERDHSAWKRASLRRGLTVPTDCEVYAGETTAPVYCAYADYALARYPGGELRLKGEQDAVLLVAGGHVRAALMPVKKE